MIPVTKPFLPPKSEIDLLLDGVWERNWLTNNGPLVNELELSLKQYLSVDHLLFLANGTLSLQIAIKALELKGEIITTPFTYVATISSIIWEGCKPVLVDIDPETLNIDPTEVEKSISQDTVAVIGTHVFGNPCDIESLEKVCSKHKLKLIFDSAHGFGAEYKNKSLFCYGDISTTSFHATKLYHTVEGGAVITDNPDLLKKMAFLRNFGHDGPENFAEVGINAKNSEFHAAMGLVNLRYVDAILDRRRLLSERYFQQLEHSGLQFVKVRKDTKYNYSYQPVIFESEELLKQTLDELKANNIYPRRYFYPSLNIIDIFPDIRLKISEDISKRILCLPMYHSLSFVEVDYITRIVKRALRYSYK